jgi:tryptophan synthase alpha chain
MNPIDALFQRLRAQNRKAFIPFLTAGDPDLATTRLLCEEMAHSGASLIEIGFPYSDPIADGPVIQASYTRALARGVQLEDIFRTVEQIARSEIIRERRVPLVGMVSYALVHHRGARPFLARAQEAGFSGAIVPDLPVEEADELARLAAERDFKLIHLVTPTTPPDRAVRIARSSSGFLYYVSVAGITGERDRLPEGLVGQLRWLRTQTELPLCVGFGISKPEHARLLRDVADGIIVGSAMVRRLEQANSRPLPEITREISDLARSLAEALNPGPGK